MTARKPNLSKLMRFKMQTKPTRLQALSAIGRFLFGFAFTLILSGFLIFVIYVNTATPPKDIPHADGIVVLTGTGGGRLAAGAYLLKHGYGERLLISGVNPLNDSQTMRDLLDLDEEKFLCCVDLDYKATNTVDNAVQTASWAKTLGYERIILVTSSYHMPRSQLEISAEMSNIEITPYPVKSLKNKNEPWWGGLDKTKRLFREYGKLLVSFIRDPGRRPDT